MRRKTRNLLLTTAAAAAVAGSAVYLTGRVLAAAAVRRDGIKVKLPQKIQSKVSGGLTEDPNVAVATADAEKAKLLPTESVSVKSCDGLRLNGRIYHCEEPKRIILAMHGWRSDWTIDFGSSVGFYHGEHSIMVFPDQRGQNESEGDYIGFGVLERRDVLTWLEYITDRFGTELPVYLLGVSMGATTIMMATGEKLPDCVKGVIADCGFTSPHGIWKHVLDNNLKISSRPIYPIANAIVKREASFDGDEYSTVDALAKNDRPILFIHGTADRFVPLSMTFENFTACNSDKQMLIVPTAAHGMSYLTDTARYEEAVLGFFRKCEN